MNYNKLISAKVIADSISPYGQRITTLQISAPKFLDAEFEKHRMLSSNSSSDRAIPLSKMKEAPRYYPNEVRYNQPGMQGDESLPKEEVIKFHESLYGVWEAVIKMAGKWSNVHKQHINRYLLPFTIQHKVVTATDWDNFFRLRLADDAQPEIYELAEKMKDSIDESTPTILDAGEWHTPYVGKGYYSGVGKGPYNDMIAAIKCSVARCARVSYNNHDGSSPDVGKDLELYQMLLDSEHMSPFEHVATPRGSPYELGWIMDPAPLWPAGVTHIDREKTKWSGNFRNWIQYRKLVEQGVK